jgi:hypothetical protein
LENAIKQARKIADGGARKALEALAVHEPDPYRHMVEAQRDLRLRLRAQARQLGDGENKSRPGAYEIEHLVEKLAYDQWHRLLFARFLLENNLLISPGHGISVSLDDCEELAPSIGLKDSWAVAVRFAAKELPEIFRADDPAGAVELPPEDRKPLIQLVTGLPVEVFTASDSLGWCYQFWQAERKDEVNAAGNKIGADELPAVTQLFTEDYMVDFLLDNTLGAWHAAKILVANPSLAEVAKSEDELRGAVALQGCPWKYLRFIKADDGKWTPAAGTFSGWPRATKEIKCLDPCMGSGHFVVAMFERLLALRIAEEKIDEALAVVAVIRDNLFGLELDQRCTQIGAFNLALAGWRRVGHCTLPAMNLACSGLAPNSKREDWLRLAGDSDRLRRGMARLHALFADAPVLGSLINPRAADGDLLEAEFHELQPLLEKVLTQETKDDTAREIAVTARGLAKAAEILVGQFTLVATNVPYLGSGDFNSVLKKSVECHFSAGKSDLATVFLLRLVQLLGWQSSVAVVSPQNWWFLGSFTEFRKLLLSDLEWNLVATLGEEAWHSFGQRGPKATLVIAGRRTVPDNHVFYGIDALPLPTIKEKSLALSGAPLLPMRQKGQLDNPDHRITIGSEIKGHLLSRYARSYKGITTGDDPHFRRQFWEQRAINGWRFFQSTVSRSCEYGGCESILNLSQMIDPMQPGVYIRAEETWGRRGVAVSQMRTLASTLSMGEPFDTNVAVIVPKNKDALAAIWLFCSSPEFPAGVRQIDQKVGVTSATLAKVPFDLTRWQTVAADKYPQGLPKPFSSDPTQWLFDGHPKDSDQPLHVAVPRLLGYHWPRQTDSSFPDCPALDPDGLEGSADADGIVCLSATKGEAPAAERLRILLLEALRIFDLRTLIASAGPKGSKSQTLEAWLRDEFFEQHCEIFHHRPFIWHVWDGHKSGFSALVNYHQLTHSKLEKLTYAYLGDWIRRQQAAVDAGEAGSDARLQAAKQLQSRLKLILEGEPPYDIFVRWKPLSKQAIGWHPDLNDGVRINIRPLLAQDIPGGKKGAGILRVRPNIKWGKDRGKEPLRDKNEFPWFWGWDEEKLDFPGIGKEPDGNRWNDCHYTNEFKQRARKAQ